MTKVIYMHRDYKDKAGFNVGAGKPEHVQIVIDPTLEPRGECRMGDYSGYVIALREWHPSVLLHELLHVLVDQYIPYDGEGGFNHKVINTIEVGLLPHLELLQSEGI